MRKDFAWEKAEQLGIVKTLPGPHGLNMPLLVVAAKMPKGEPLKERSSRLKQFKFAKQVLDQAMSTPAPGIDGILTQGLFVFHDEHGNFRLSLVYGKAEGTKLVWSTAKRLSFHVEAGKGNKTFRARMALDWCSFDKFKEAFSVEKLTKEFYNRLFDWYQWALSDEMNVTYPNDTDWDDDDRDISEHIIRLITRLMFVWFLKQKHLVPDTLFDPEALKPVLKTFDPLKGDNYYRAILQNLFFATLNSEIPERGFATQTGDRSEHFDIKTLYRYSGEFAIPEDAVLKLFEKIPFLNGGLFECLDRGKKYCDGFSRNSNKVAKVPNRLFFDPDKGLIPLLSQYNFTVEENAPGDEEVALDPELLGKVFENLLGAYNPETKVAARNATGSFYTPREIVNYMVDESLIAYLTGKCGEELVDTIRKIFTDSERPADKTLCDVLDAALVTAKILDPACGSGAFPMGILLRMVELLRILRGLPEDASVYDLKLQLIENCIYGGDIQCIAVQISKLRFFISLVCEQKPTSDPKNNYGIHTLPNLETKFVAADSLIGLPKPGNELPMLNVETLKKELWAVRHKHFLARSYREKKELRKEDKKLRTDLANALEQGGGFDTASAKLMAAWDPYDQNTSAPFSDPEWMFNVKNGFDIVIGNPPYIFARNSATKGMSQEKKKYYYANYTLAEYQVNLYPLFIEAGSRILGRSGTLCFITPNNWLTLNTNGNLRKFVMGKTKISILNFYARVFESADVDAAITIFQNSSKDAKAESIRLFEWTTQPVLIAESPKSKFFEQHDCIINIEALKSGDTLDLMEKIEKATRPLKQVANVKCGLGAYGHGDGTPPQTDEMIKQRIYHSKSKKGPDWFKYIEGADVKRYSIEWQNEEYLQYGKNLREPRSNWKLFSSPRILVRQIPSQPPYCINASFSEETFLNDRNSMNIINITVAPPLLLGVLNSRLISYWFVHKFGKMQRGIFPQFKVNELAMFPVPASFAPHESRIIDLVDRILSLKKSAPSADTTALEAEIDELVYDLYGLTEEEKAIVRASTAHKEQKNSDQEIPDAEEDEASTSSEPKIAPKKRGRKPQLPPSLPGWD